MFRLVIAGFLGMLISNAVLADSTAECKVKGGSKEGSTVAPKEFSLEESGRVILRVNDGDKMKDLVTINVGDNDRIYYLNKPIKIQVGSTKKLKVGERSGQETFSFDACDDTETLKATYKFQWKDGLKVAVKRATYECTCSLD